MLIKIEDNELNGLNQKGISDIEVLHQLFNVTKLMEQSQSQRIQQYFQNYYNDLKVFVLRRDFIELYPKIDAIEKDWFCSLPAYNATGLKLSDDVIESKLSSKHNKTIDDFKLSIQSLGHLSHNEKLKGIQKTFVSQNEFVNQKTVYNTLVSDVLDANVHLTQFPIKEALIIASNDIINTKELKKEKRWTPKIS